MRHFPIALVIALMVPGVAQGQVAGTLNVTWGNQCAPIVVDASPAPGETATITVFVEGQQIAHQGYEIHLILGRWDGSVPDAWRFDAEGCQGSSGLAILGSPPPVLVKACPAFSQTAQALVVSGTDYFFYQRRFSELYLLRVSLASSYPLAVVPNPAQRYFLAQFQFDHTFSVAGPTTPGVNCGEVDLGVCIALDPGNIWGLEKCQFLRSPDGLGQEFQFGQSWLTTEEETGCPSVPARASTWGQIKGVYRR